MVRREFVVGSIAFAKAAQYTPLQPYNKLSDKPKTSKIEIQKPKRNDDQYEICKHRGHRVAQANVKPSNMVGGVSEFERPLDVVTYTEPAKTETTPGYIQKGEWQLCFDCGREFRLVTKLEER